MIRGGGAIAGGSALTVEAGLRALRAGGNAVDAAVASSLMAMVAEPLLTGPGGAGIALVRMGGRVRTFDMFANIPGIADPEATAPLMQPVEVKLGTRRYRVGPAAVAVPGLLPGLARMHRRHGSLPLRLLVEPAALTARAGFQVDEGFEQVARLLWPILSRSLPAASLFGREGRALRRGERFSCPALGETLERFAIEGEELFRSGELGRAIAESLADGSRFSVKDLQHYEASERSALEYRYRDASVWVPGPPSASGLLVLQALRSLEDHGRMPAPRSAAQVRFFAHALARIDRVRSGSLRQHLFTPGWVEGFLAALAPDEVGEESAFGAPSTNGGLARPGHTTHISTVDGAGNAVSITSSLGETAGVMVEKHGILLNNFLGEPEVNPPGSQRAAGERLMTMAAPTLLKLGDRLHALGTGGSNRIPSVLLHGLVYLTDHGLSPVQAVLAPRCHFEAGVLQVESADRPAGALEALAVSHPGLARFDKPNMFFGGLHIAAVDPQGFSGAGDPRRAGAFGVAEAGGPAPTIVP